MEIPEHGKCVIKSGNGANDPVEIIADHVREMIADGAAGDKLIITLLEMTEREYDSLPEWDGW